MTGAIVRIKNPLIRVPAWSIWWPFAVADCCIGAIASGNWQRLFSSEFWAFQMTILVIGIDGLEAT